MNTLRNWIRHNWITLLGIALGAIAGFLYWSQIGCASGTCAITSNWLNSTVYGAVMGGLLLSFFSNTKKKQHG
jgi:Family of unknown function (DUF6132)